MSEHNSNDRKQEWGWRGLVAWCLLLVAIVGAAMLLVG
jgi:hypothetical protein